LNTRTKSILLFSLSFVLILGSYVALNVVGDWNNSETGFLAAMGVAAVYIPVALAGYFVAVKKSKPLALGFIFGLVGITIYFFSFGGCGILRLFT
jgi:hypothetical protein